MIRNPKVFGTESTGIFTTTNVVVVILPLKQVVFAVGEEYAHSGLGSDLLSLVKKQYAMGNRAGCRFLTVDAYRDATKFYEKNGFDYFTTLDVLIVRA